MASRLDAMRKKVEVKKGAKKPGAGVGAKYTFQKIVKSKGRNLKGMQKRLERGKK